MNMFEIGGTSVKGGPRTGRKHINFNDLNRIARIGGRPIIACPPTATCSVFCHELAAPRKLEGRVLGRLSARELATAAQSRCGAWMRRRWAVQRGGGKASAQNGGAIASGA